MRAVVQVGWVRARMGWTSKSLPWASAPVRSSSWNRIASAIMVASSSGTVTSVVLRRPPALSMHAYSGSSSNSPGRLRASSVRSTFTGPHPFDTPLTRESSAFAAPRCGVPSVITLRVISWPPSTSVK